jgi:hypothetical protein
MNGVKVGVWTNIISYNIHDESCESALILFFSAHVFLHLKRSRRLKAKISLPVQKTCWLWFSQPCQKPTSWGAPQLIIPWNASSHLLAYNGPTPHGQMDGWMDGWIIIAYNQYYSCVYSFMWVCVCEWMNEWIYCARRWRVAIMCHHMRNWLLKILCVPTRIDHLLGGYSLSRRWRAFFFFLYHLLGGYSLSHGWRAFFLLRPIRGERFVFTNVSKRWEENKSFLKKKSLGQTYTTTSNKWPN